jgi:hypothetical protein
VLGERALSGGVPTFAVKCPNKVCRRDFQRRGDRFGLELVALVRTGMTTLDISRLPF